MTVKKLCIIENQPGCLPGASRCLAIGRIVTIVDIKGWSFPIHNFHNSALGRANGIEPPVGKSEGPGISLSRCFDHTFIFANRGEAKDMTGVWIECIDPAGFVINHSVMGTLELDPANLFGLGGDGILAGISKGY